MARGRSTWRPMLRTPVGIAATALLVVVVLLAVVAPIVWGSKAAAVDPGALQQDPSSAHLLGTDDLGRDVLYRVLVATRLSLELSLLATLIGVAAGTVLGTAPSVLPRRLGRLVTAIVNIAIAFPGLLLALFFAVIFGLGTKAAVLAIGFAMAPSFARVAQPLATSVAGRDFVAAARVAGVGRFRILFRHILPNIGEPLVVNATVGAGASLVAFAGLSFLGIGVQAPSYDWGRLLGESLSGIYTNPAAAIAPGVAVVIAGLAFNLFGETAAAVVGVRTISVRPMRQATRFARRDSGRAAPPKDNAVLVVENLRVVFPSTAGGTTPVRGVTFTVRAGESVGLVGESGSGKSLTALGLSQLIRAPGSVTADRLDFLGTSLLGLSEREQRRLLGMSLAMVFQDPTTSFNPALRVGRQLAEVSEEHEGLSRKVAAAKAIDRLRAVRVPAPERRARQYPHELSGGTRQRAMIGMGLMGEPRLIVADEPTTALDASVQRKVLRLLARSRADRGAAILLISHDLAVISQMCDQTLVMYAGRIVEDLPTARLASEARHPYTRALLAAAPNLQIERDEPLAVIPGRPPDPKLLPEGCAFAPRCSAAGDRCRTEDPGLIAVGSAHRVACWHPVTPDAATGPATVLTAGGEQ